MGSALQYLRAPRGCRAIRHQREGRLEGAIMDVNFFGNTDIELPDKYREYFHRYCLTRTEGSRNDPESSPFPRMVDMWFLAMCFAVNLGLEPVLKPEGKLYKAIEGAVFGSDPWRSNAMMLVAIGYTGNINTARDPNEMMRLANGFAIAGLPHLITRLEERGGDTALDHLSDEVSEVIAAAAKGQPGHKG